MGIQAAGVWQFSQGAFSEPWGFGVGTGEEASRQVLAPSAICHARSTESDSSIRKGLSNTRFGQVAA
jgi:hypothetical protein